MRVIRKIGDICRQVPMLPVTIAAAIFVTIFWNYRPWLNGVGALNAGNFVAAPPSAGAWHIGPFAFNPSVGQLIVVLLVAYSVFDSVRGMIASLKAGHVGIDVLAILALLSTLGVQEYWASWAVVLMIWSGEAIEEFAQTRAEGNLSALIAAAPQMAHISDLPGVGLAGRSSAGCPADKTKPQNVETAGNVSSGAIQRPQTIETGVDSAARNETPKPNTNAANNHLDALFANSDKRLADGFRATLATALPQVNLQDLENNVCRVDPNDCSCELASVAKGSAENRWETGRTNGGKQGENVVDDTDQSRPDAGECDVRGHLANNTETNVQTISRSQGRYSQVPGSLARHTFIGGSLARNSQAVKIMESQASQDAHFHTVPVDQVALGDVLVVLPGETIPVDGKLLSGTATLDLSAINGEPLPRTVFAGARVMSGAINGSTMIVIRATSLARDSQYQQTMQLVDSARSSRAPVVKTADVLAVPFTIISLVIGIVAWIASGTPERFAQVLVLATPCPLLIAAPVAYMAGTGRLAKAGILTKTQEVLENLGKVSHIFFDKTGTLTVTKPQVVRVDVPEAARKRLPIVLKFDKNQSESQSEQYIEDLIVELAAVVESYSVHILAQGIVAAGAMASKKLHNGRATFPVVKGVHEDAGNGVQGMVEGHTVRVGRLNFVVNASSANGIDDRLESKSPRNTDIFDNSDSVLRSVGAFPTSQFKPRSADEMVAYVSVDGILAARIVLRDVPRNNARESLQRLRSMGIGKVTMLTGDSHSSADVIAGEVGIDDVRADLLPQDKVSAVRAASREALQHPSKIETFLDRLSGQPKPRPISVMVGDGVNDAPVLAAADIGIAMTDGTSTAASQTAQVVIMNDDIGDVPKAVAIARQTKRTMLQAVVTGLGLALVCMVAAAFDFIPVVVGAFTQEAIDVVSILWALTALRERK
ncbi:heavy metal translocating P-type ATPase [Bifidobacterium sp. ESL0728]|uniref:heavy metal translocating P-type ATPase n=1 Tax=Bifidobacterium sp. ESL0728 TaxID=2983220 RepID=UPI0023F934F0|nr:heavy metal translocating P-type ATPase [Bifidobacterium sp. ESL0728]WEV58953.1 heavy metal translocating P-type ATPase [Bifidobacterium sp. ESL0728]